VGLLPRKDLSSAPEAGFAWASVDDRLREVVVAVLVRGDAVALTKAEDAGDLHCVNKVVRCLLTLHKTSLLL